MESLPSLTVASVIKPSTNTCSYLSIVLRVLENPSGLKTISNVVLAGISISGLILSA